MVEKVDQANMASDDEPRTCTMADAAATYKEMTDHGSNVFVRQTSLHQKIVLLSLAQVIKRDGVPEVELQKVSLLPLPAPPRPCASRSARID